MMEKFKKTPLELDNSMPKELNSLIKKKMKLLPKFGEANKRINISKSHSRSQKCSNNEKYKNIVIDFNQSTEHLA